MSDGKYSKARYIRDTNLGLLGDPTYRCCEIEVYNPDNINIAINGTIKFICDLYDMNEASCGNPNNANNGTIEMNTSAMCKISTPTNPGSRKGIILDLGDVYEIKNINVRHSWKNGEVYIQNVVEISTDGLNWVVVQDSSIFGDYTETEDGLDIEVPYGIGSVSGDGGTANIPGKTVIISSSKPINKNIVWFEVTNMSVSGRDKKDTTNSKYKLKM